MPKKPDNKAQKKEKEIIKIAEDKTFGLKNKNKSQKVKKFIKQIASKEKGGLEKLTADIYKEKQDKKKMLEEKKFMESILSSGTAPQQNQTDNEIPICELYQLGMCNKGKSCKFRHEISENPMRTDKIDLFTDQRDILFGNKDTIEHWDIEKLKEVVDFNEAKYNQGKKTDKVCKYFLEAVEKKQYGWLWVCPNGYDCIYKHCLPQDYVFKKVIKETKIEKNQQELIEEIDFKRDQLEQSRTTPVTKESFMKWLEQRKARKTKEREEKQKEELQQQGIKMKNLKTGRELFSKEKEIFQDAEDAISDYEREDNQEQKKDMGKENQQNQKEKNLEEINKEKEIEENLIKKVKDLKINKNIFEEEEELPDLDDGTET